MRNSFILLLIFVFLTGIMWTSCKHPRKVDSHKITIVHKLPDKFKMQCIKMHKKETDGTDIFWYWYILTLSNNNCMYYSSTEPVENISSIKNWSVSKEAPEELRDSKNEAEVLKEESVSKEELSEEAQTEASNEEATAGESSTETSSESASDAEDAGGGDAGGSSDAGGGDAGGGDGGGGD